MDITYFFAFFVVLLSVGIFKFNRDKRLSKTSEEVRNDVYLKIHNSEKGRTSDASNYRTDGNFGAGVKGARDDVDYSFHDCRYGHERKVENIDDLVIEAEKINTDIYETFDIDSEKVKDKEYEVLHHIRELEMMAREAYRGVEDYREEEPLQLLESTREAEDKRMLDAENKYKKIIEICSSKYSELELNKERRKIKDVDVKNN